MLRRYMLDRMMRFLASLGSKTYLIAGLVTSIQLLGKSCAEEPCAPGLDACEIGGAAGDGGTAGAAGEGGEGGTGAAGGQGGEVTGGAGGTGGATGGGGAGGSTASTGGAGGAGGVGGQGGTGGACVSTFACGPKDCGMVDDGCGVMLDCDATPEGPVTCSTQSGGAPEGPDGGPMVCNAQTHTCDCVPEGGSAEATALCDGTVVQVPGVAESCAMNGGCDAALCGTPPVPKVPSNCLYGGAKQDGTQIWCCTMPPG